MRRVNIKRIGMWVAPVCLLAVAGFGSHLALGQKPEASSAGKADGSATVAPENETPTCGDTPGALKIPQALLEKRVELAREVYKLNLRRIQVDQKFSLYNLFGWSERLLEAEWAMNKNRAEQVQALKDYLVRTRELEKSVQLLFNQGLAVKADADAATYFRVEAEIRLLREGVQP